MGKTALRSHTKGKDHVAKLLHQNNSLKVDYFLPRPINLENKAKAPTSFQQASHQDSEQVEEVKVDNTASNSITTRFTAIHVELHPANSSDSDVEKGAEITRFHRIRVLSFLLLLLCQILQGDCTELTSFMILIHPQIYHPSRSGSDLYTGYQFLDKDTVNCQ
ncbi:uncharacterized protein LOC117176000 [Belonocnema kinseyi]|uniref:uncharacterized protein LOC117176000 n=1 Tax=Belonocnema kinseyi TaxID=2817044 RepID=UPI00143DE26C|nr:uncharacterized protein LOC117176000 [Belonocnema kinseyi]